MKLQEQINRIQSMIGILTENKSKKLQIFQTLIDSVINSMRNVCDFENTEDDEYIAISVCDLIDSSLKVNLIDFTQETGINLIVDITYKNYSHLDEDEFLSELKDRLKIMIPISGIEVNSYENLFQH